MLVLVAGSIAVGKTTFSHALADRTGATHLSVRQALIDALGASRLTRAQLQSRGADLDRRTNGRWLLHHLEERIETTPDLVVDSLRTRRQTVPLLDNLTESVLVYLHAHDSTRLHRYTEAAASDTVKAAVSYSEAINHPTERAVVDLEPLAHLVIATDDLLAYDAAGEVIHHFGLAEARSTNPEYG